jgi:hypothetical protein
MDATVEKIERALGWETKTKVAKKEGEKPKRPKNIETLKKTHTLSENAQKLINHLKSLDVEEEIAVVS